MKSTLIIYLCSLLLFVGCEKEEPETTISGTVVNFGTLQPIDSVFVTVVSGDGKGTYGDTKGSGSEVSAFTNKEGKFSIKIKGENLFLYLKKDKYWYDEEIFGAFKSYTAGKIYSNEVLKYYAYSKFDGYFQCINCLISDSAFYSDCSNLVNGKLSHSGDDFYKANEISKSRFFFSIIPGDTYFKYAIKCQKQGIWQPLIIDSVYIKSFETYTDTIYY